MRERPMFCTWNALPSDLENEKDLAIIRTMRNRTSCEPGIHESSLQRKFTPGDESSLQETKIHCRGRKFTAGDESSLQPRNSHKTAHREVHSTSINAESVREFCCEIKLHT